MCELERTLHANNGDSYVPWSIISKQSQTHDWLHTRSCLPLLFSCQTYSANFSGTFCRMYFFKSSSWFINHVIHAEFKKTMLTTMSVCDVPSLTTVSCRQEEEISSHSILSDRRPFSFYESGETTIFVFPVHTLMLSFCSVCAFFFLLNCSPDTHHKAFLPPWFLRLILFNCAFCSHTNRF